MRITTNGNYYHEFTCDFDECFRHYYEEQRLLWRDCDTPKAGIDGYHMDNSPHQREWEEKRFHRMIETDIDSALEFKKLKNDRSENQ